MCRGNCILVHHSNLLRIMAFLFCALNVLLVLAEVKVKVYHRKHKKGN